ncbi:group 1 glycosyl transferase [Candidatus Vecturithrix granuli]|uniref:Group 1 glycosyl transferase n=1 Tax=Vecturithrix granuli TaxID=1499967 RepID=A0A081C4B5_VECG1|nr:group 1 glycosyl transferase [Candidatus Vecturithrix granuli]
MFENLRADLNRFAEETDSKNSSFRIFIRGLLSQGFQALFVYRFFRWFHVRGIPTQPFRFIFERFIEIITGISIPAETDIGKGLRIHHFGGVIFHSHVKMGEHCTIYHEVTFGDKGGWGEPPTVGNNVLIGAGAKILGDITIGDNVIIGANSVVTKSVPPNVIVGGIPAKIIGENKSLDHKNNSTTPPSSSQRKINVLQCRSTYTTGGGPDKTVLLAAEKHDRDKFNIILMYMRGTDDTEFQIAKWAREKGLTIHEVLEHKKLDLKNLREIHQLIRTYHIDIYHARDYKTCFIGYLLSKIHPRMKLVFTAHGWVVDSTKQKLYTWLNLFSLKKYHKMIAVSHATKQLMLDSGLDSKKITVVHNAIDVETWTREKVTPTLRAELQISSTSKIVGVVGRLRWEKDLQSTLNVAEKVIRERPDTYFILVGDGPDRAELEQQVRHRGLSEKVLFLGFRKDAMNIYASLDLFASTSLMEGTPNTVLEALAMEVPVVYTDVGGVHEMIENGYNGILCQVGDVDGISQAILSILCDPEKANMLKENGRKTICQKFSFTNRLKTVEAIYEEVMGMH